MDTGPARHVSFPTMRGSLWHRLSSAVCGLWLVTALTEPSALHSCPLHGSHGNAHNHAAAAPSHGGAHSHTGHDKSEQCTCIGACCCVVAVATVPSAAHVLTFVAVVLPTKPLVPTATDNRPPTPQDCRHPAIGALD